MINLLCLLCSLCIQFGAAQIQPYNMWALNAENASYIETVKSQITGSKSRYWSSFSAFVDIPNEYWIVIKGFNSSGSDIVCLAPNEYVDNTKTTSITCDAYTVDDNNTVSTVKLKFNQYKVFPVATNATWVENNANIYGWKTYNFLSGNWSLLYCQTPIYYNSSLLVTVTDDVTVPVLLSQLGSMSGGGHSSGGSPLESLSGLSWASVTGHSSGGAIAPSPHSSSTHFNTTTQSPDSNDSKTDNLLYMLGNKLADITENTSGIVSALGGVMYNVMQGASTIFNGISALNDNIINFASYLTAVPTSQDISDALDECENIGSLRDLSESINIWSELGLTQVNSAPTYTFNFAGTMFESMGNFTLNFNFLDSTKNLWQPLFIALLYFNLLVTILTGLPDLIQGRGET